MQRNKQPHGVVMVILPSRSRIFPMYDFRTIFELFVFPCSSPRVCPSSVDFMSGGSLVKGRRQEKGRNSDFIQRQSDSSPSTLPYFHAWCVCSACPIHLFMSILYGQPVSLQSVMLPVSCDETRREKSDTRTSIMYTTPFVFHKHMSREC